MDILALARRYLDAWNTRDTGRLAGAFREGGTYEDPNTGGPVGTNALSEYAAGLFTAFPDLAFEDTGLRVSGEREVIVPWIMRGTNRGSLRGLPPTGAIIALPGLDVVEVRADGVERVQGFFDRQTLMEQLGLQVVVQPWAVGDIRFGVCTQVRSGDWKAPGAVALTMIDARSDAEVQEIRDVSRQIMKQLPSMPGFLAFQGAVVGRRLTTVTLWEDRQSARHIMREPIHKDAASRMFGGAVGAAFHSSSWVPERLGELWVRCRACDGLWDARAVRACRCGETNAVPPAYW